MKKIYICFIILFISTIMSSGYTDVAGDKESFTFIVTSDTHFGSDISKERLNKLSSSINTIDPDFLVITGDLVSANVYGWEESSKRYAEFRENITIPIFELPGNHDAVNRYSNEWINTTNKPLYYSFDWKGIHFIALADENEDWTGTISKEQLIWFQNDVKNNSNKTIIVFSHQPLPYTVYGSYTPQDNISVLGHPNDILRILNTTRAVKIWFSGHHHVDSSFKPSIKETYGITHINAGPVLDTRGSGTLEIRIINVQKNNINVKIYDVERGSFYNDSYLIKTKTSLNNNTVKGLISDSYSSKYKSNYLSRQIKLVSYSFENISDGIPDRWQLYKTSNDNSTWRLISNNTKDGKYAIRVVKYNNEGSSNLVGTIYPITGQLYTLSAWHRTDTPNNIGLSIHWIDKNGKTIKRSDVRKSSGREWNQIDLTSPVPDGAVKAELHLKVFNKSSVDWDLVEVKYWDYGTDKQDLIR